MVTRSQSISVTQATATLNAQQLQTPIPLVCDVADLHPYLQHRTWVDQWIKAWDMTALLMAFDFTVEKD